MLWPLLLARVPWAASQASTAVGEAGKRSLSAHQGAAVPSTGSGAGTASSATPSQSSKGSNCSSLDPGVLANTTPIGPAGRLHFTCSPHVAPGERFFC